METVDPNIAGTFIYSGGKAFTLSVEMFEFFVQEHFHEWDAGLYLFNP